MDDNQQPAQFHAAIGRRRRDHNSNSFENDENMWLPGARSNGFVSMTCTNFQPSTLSSHMVGARNMAVHGDAQKRLSF